MKLALIALLMSVSTAFAQVPTGTQGFADLGVPRANGSPTGNILTASVFTIGDLVSTQAQTGIFEGLPLQSFGSITFNINQANSFVFNDGPFGTFTSTFIDPTTTGSSITFFMLGNWSPGAFESGVKAGSYGSELTIAFTQTPGGNGSISDSATFSTPVETRGVPEPSSLALLALGLGGLMLVRRRK